MCAQPSKGFSSRFSGLLGIGSLLITVAMITPTIAVENESTDGSAAKATLPGAPRLLPVDTLAYIRLDDAEDLRDDMGKSSLGMMIDDPKMRPFADAFYSTAHELFDSISERVGVTLDELLSIPHGQVAIAIHPAKPMDDEEKPKINITGEEEESELQKRRNRIRLRESFSFGGVLIIDAGKNIDRLMTMVDRLEEAAVRNGQVPRVKEVGKTEITRILPRRAGHMPLEFFERDGTLVIGIGHRSAQDVLDHWLEKSDEQTLADNANFGTIMSRCIGAEDTRPQLTMYFDPHGIIDRVVKLSGSFTGGIVWSTIQNMGATRIAGIGCSSFRGGEIFEGIVHYHIKIDPPRDGVLAALRPLTGETTPPNWIPDSVIGYSSFNWDFAQTYENVGKTIDEFQGDDSLKRFVEEPVQKRLGIELQEDVLENLTGRFVRAVYIQKPMRMNSGVTCLAFEITDAIKTKAVLAKVRDRMPERMKVETVAGHVVYRGPSPGKRFPQHLRKPEPSLMILDKWLIYTDSLELIEKIAQTHAGNLPRLVDLPEYGLVTSEIGGKLDGEKPFMLSYIDGAESMRLVYDLIKDENSKKFLSNVGEKNVVARKFAELLENHELPPFAEFKQYFAPSGTFAYDEPDGIHFGIFTLRPDPTVE